LEPWGSFIEPLLNPRCALSRSVGFSIAKTVTRLIEQIEGSLYRTRAVY
jgi:hypothetical protein